MPTCPTCWGLQDSTNWDHTDRGSDLGWTSSWLSPYTGDADNLGGLLWGAY